MTSPMATRGELRAALAACERACADAGPPSDVLRVRADTLRGVFDIGVTARVAVVGRRGAGKSTLLNALAGSVVARVGDVADATMSARVMPLPVGMLWLDTPGLRAGGRVGRLDAVRAAVTAFAPTVVLLACASTEVDAGIDEDLDDFGAVLGALDAGVARIAVVTRVDELAPPDVLTPPFDDEEKRANIERAVATLRRHATRRGMAPRVTLPVCAFVAWEGGRAIDDARWNLDALVRDVLATRAMDPAAELASLTHGFADAVVEHFALMAEEVALRAPATRRRELLGALHSSMVDALAGFVGAMTGRTLGGHAPIGVMSEALRGVLDGIGASRAGAAVASARVRALGRSLLARELLTPSPEAIAAIAG